MVERFDTLLRFKVASRSRPDHEPHTVNLAAYAGHGDCDCEQFTYRLADEIARNGPQGDKTRCAHIREAREFFCNEMVAVMAAQQPKPPPQ